MAFSLNIRVLILAIILIPVLLSLGQWQLRRAAEKQTILDKVDARWAQAPVNFDSLAIDEDLAFIPVRIKGSYDVGHMFLLDNRVRAGLVGYEVLVPLLTDNGVWVLINCGWTEAPPLRSQLPYLPNLPREPLSLTARVYVPPGDGFQLQEDSMSVEQWPHTLQTVDMEKIAQLLSRPMFPYQLRLEASEPGALLIDWQPINQSPAKHHAYALQWFAMAIALIIWLLAASFSRKTTSNQKDAD